MKTAKPAFSSEFQKELAQGKYTRWAVDLDEETLQFLLHVVGEYGCRASKWARLREYLDAPVSKPWERRGAGFLRLILALRAIRDIERGRGREAKKDFVLDITAAFTRKTAADGSE